MKIGFYPRLAADGMRKNARLYVPYLIACVMMVAVYYILHFLGHSVVMDGMPGGNTAETLMQLGTFVMTLFGTLFLFYTQSALIKGRKKEFGLYSILGMNRFNLGRILFFETLIVWAVSVAGGLAAGITLSGLAKAGFAKMVGSAARSAVLVPAGSVAWTAGTFSFIFLLILLNSLRQVGFSSPIELVRAEKAGEKPPKSNWFVGILGFLTLGTGYFIALRIKQPMSALLWFFAAVILIIIGTYLLLVAGSVIFCRLLRKNKRYYYRTNHFVSVSSMAFRMKRNGAGLASICILLTMILVMLSSTAALYAGADECLDLRYPNEIGAFACKYGYDEGLESLGEKLDADLKQAAMEHGAAITNNATFYEWSISGYFDDGRLDVTLNSLTDMAFIDYDKVAQILFIDRDVYNRVFGCSEEVGPGEALVGTAKKIPIGDTITVGDVSFRVTKRIDDRVGEIDPSARISASPGIFLIVDDVNEVAKHYIKYADFNGEPMLAWFWHCRFDTGLAPQQQEALAQTLDELLDEELEPYDFDNRYCESHEGERGDFVGTFGGLLFLGMLLSLIFLASCAIIMYYKQVSEGFEDQARFGIMQKVGMTKEEIRRSVDSQMLTVFLIPILFACVHLLAVLPVVMKLLMLFGLFDIPLLLTAAGICVLVCGAVYAGIYRLTSNAYYRIVS